MADTFGFRAIEWLMRNVGPELPLRFTVRPYPRAVRLAALVWFALWLFPSMSVLIVPMVGLMVCDVVEDTWRGNS